MFFEETKERLFRPSKKKTEIIRNFFLNLKKHTNLTNKNKTYRFSEKKCKDSPKYLP